MRISAIGGMVAGIGVLSMLLVVAQLLRSTVPWPAPACETKTKVVATVGTRSITLAEVEQAIALPLYQAEEQRTKLLYESIQHLIEEKLLADEAAKTGVTVHELIERASKSKTITKMADLPSQVGKQQIEQQAVSPPFHASEEVARIRQALLVHLRRKSQIYVNLSAPQIPVLSVSPDDDPWTGAVNAPVTIIEFSDFECPYCRKTVPVLKELLEKYSGKLKLVYRDFPGPNHHHALSAAEAAQCAAEQGQFWKYHDAIFSRQMLNMGWDFSALAQHLALHQSAFDACMKEHRYREEVMKDLRDGLELGVTSTPTFFINGRPLVGAKPLADFQALIDPLLNQPIFP